MKWPVPLRASRADSGPGSGGGEGAERLRVLTQWLGPVCGWVVSCDGLTKAESHLGALGQAGRKAGFSTEQFQVMVA